MRDNFGNAIDNFFEYCAEFPGLAIYGAGDVGRMVAEFMEREGVPFDCFCVSEKPAMRMHDGHEIKGIDEALASGIEMGIVVAVSRKNAGAILHLLEGRNSSYFYSTDFLFQLFERKCRESVSKVLIQNEYIHGISEMAFDRDVLYICCPASIGDTLYTAAFVRAYKKENASVKKVCLILKNGHRELGGLFAAVDETLISDDIVEILDRYSLYTQTWRLKNYLYGHFKKSIHFVYDPEYDQEGCRTILARYRKLVMGLSDDAEPECMALNRDFMQMKNSLQLEEKKYDVVIMPYARTAKLLPEFFWEELAGELIQRGYFVYTNIGGGKEKAIQGTIPMTESLLDTALFCEKCSAVIALRSGLCDLLGFTKANLVVVNTSEELANEWNLKDVFARDGIYNVNCFENVDLHQGFDVIMGIMDCIRNE